METNNVTNAQIKALKNDAGEHGDLRMAMICDLALHGTETLEGAEPGADAADLLSEGRTQEWARAQCAGVIAYAAGEAQS